MRLLFLALFLSSTSSLAATVSVTPEIVTPGQPITLVYENADWQESKKVWVHFGFNGWNLPLSGEGAGSDHVGRKLNHFRRLPLTKANGKWQITIDVPEDGRAMHMAFCRHKCMEWDNNHSEDYHLTIAYPFIGPIVTKTAQGLSISVINTEAIGSTLHLRDTESGLTTTHQALADRSQRFVIPNLRHGRTYTYRVSDAKGRQSKEFALTLPGASPDDLDFIVIGDIQDDGKNGRFQDVVAHILQHQAGVPMIVSSGDLPWDDKPAHWWTLFDKGKELFASKIFLAAAGNHDTPTVGNHPDSTRFRYYFDYDFPTEGSSWHAHKTGPASFYFLNSNIARDFRSDGRQTRWLKEQLAADTSPWTFVLWHSPPFNAGIRHYYEQGAYREPVKAFDGQVDWFFGGHEHMYQRTKPLTWDGENIRTFDSYQQATGFLLVPSAGTKPNSKFAKNPLFFSRKYLDSGSMPAFRGYATVSLKSGSIHLKTWSAEASEPVDQVQYQK